MKKKLSKLSEQDLQLEVKEPNVLRIYPAEEPKDFTVLRYFGPHLTM